MGRIKKRGTSGNAKNFITRTQAIKKLQISLADFRRLCIFKGIYPREPRNKKKANKGSTAPVTFYYSKDIHYLLHEPILNKFRQHKTFAKKLTKYLGKGEINQANKLNKQHEISNYNLNHIIKERYPTFLDALRDLDDPLNMLFLFSNMPTTDKVSSKIISNCEKLCNQWLAYVAKEHLLKKVFVSIKGVYYQVTIKGQEIRWLVPFKFPTNIPSDVDFRIMLTFLEFYSTLLHFVLFKLYNEVDLVYPPKIDFKNLKNIGGLNNFILQSKEESNNNPQPIEETNKEKGKELSTEEYEKAIEADKEEQEDEGEDVAVVNDELDEFNTNSEKVDKLIQPSKYQSPTSTLFSNFIFFIGREVSLDILQFCILSCDGKIISEIQLDELKINDPKAFENLNLDNITHQIIDRPKILNKVPGRTYIQPQWIFDCINKQELVNVNDYAPGETLPPHLSPWGDAGSYNPNKETENENENEEEIEESESEDEEIEVEEGDEDQEEDEDEMDDELKAQKELEMEAKGVKYSELDNDNTNKKQKKSKANKEVDEEKELKKIMMTNKQKKLYKKMQYGIEKKENRDKELTKKRKQLDKKKKQLKEL